MESKLVAIDKEINELQVRMSELAKEREEYSNHVRSAIDKYKLSDQTYSFGSVYLQENGSLNVSYYKDSDYSLYHDYITIPAGHHETKELVEAWASKERTKRDTTRAEIERRAQESTDLSQLDKLIKKYPDQAKKKAKEFLGLADDVWP